MPTGYTCDIKSGQSFNDFVMGCAKAFGACVSMRDDSFDAEIPDKFEPSDYHSKEMARAESRLVELKAMSTKDIEVRLTLEYDKEIKERASAVSENARKIKAYEAMLVKVKAWNPPTSDHHRFKDFMISQIKQSIKFDDMSDYYNDNPVPKFSAKKWFDHKMERALYDIKYHKNGWEEEVSRCNERSEWVCDLRKSLV